MAKKIDLNFKLLEYDIETAHLKARVWGLGDQAVRHDQLLPSADRFRILTISYKFYHQDKVYTLTCGKDGSGEKKMIEDFDRVIRSADVTIGKNNYRFDDKRVNAARMIHDLEPMPEWVYKSEDLESQIRRYFSLPSYSLDYLSKILGFGGKNKMERSDWSAIEDSIDLEKAAKFIKNKKTLDSLSKLFFGKLSSEIFKAGKEAWAKMIKYNQKDILDTEAGLIKVLPHIQLKHNAATRRISPYACIKCGSNIVEKTRYVARGSQLRFEFKCLSHNGYAGSRPFRRDAGRNVRFTGPMGK